MAEFYLDHNVSLDAAYLLRRAGHDVRTARGLGLERAGDQRHLLLAARSGWILVTHNAKDFTLLHAAWRQWTLEWGVNKAHGGILALLPPISARELVELIESLLAEGSPVQNELFVWRRARGWARHSSSNVFYQ